MFSFIMDNLATILINLALLGIVISVIVRAVKNRGQSACASCNGCAGREEPCDKKEKIA